MLLENARSITDGQTTAQAKQAVSASTIMGLALAKTLASAYLMIMSLTVKPLLIVIGLHHAAALQTLAPLIPARALALLKAALGI